MPFLPPNQQRQSTEGKSVNNNSVPKIIINDTMNLFLNCNHQWWFNAGAAEGGGTQAHPNRG